MIKFKEFLKELPIIETVFGRRSSIIKSLHEEKDPVDKLKKHYNNFDDNDKDNIIHYTSWGSEYMNKHLLYPSKHRDNSKTHAHIKDLDKTLRKHKTPEELHVYSGIDVKHAENLLSLSKKSKSSTFQMHHPAYLSTSIDKKIAKVFSDRDSQNNKHILHIKIPKGSSGAYVDHLSRNTGEREFILPRGHVLSINKNPDINKIPRSQNSWSIDPIHVYTWHATLGPRKLDK